MFKWEIYCCDLVHVSEGSSPPTQTEEVSLFVNAEDGGLALNKARNILVRDHYQVVDCE